MRLIGLQIIIVVVMILAYELPSDSKSLNQIPEPTFAKKYQEDDKTLGIKAYGILRKKCSRLFNKYGSDIETIQIVVTNPPNFMIPTSYKDFCKFDYLCEQHGWKIQIKVMIKIKDRTLSIPADYRAFGHTLTYVMGGGHAPGIISRKNEEQRVCGWPIGYGSNVHIDAAELSFLPEI